MTHNSTIMAQEFPRVIRKVLSKSAKWKAMPSMINKSSYKTLNFNWIQHTTVLAGKSHGHIQSSKIYLRPVAMIGSSKYGRKWRRTNGDAYTGHRLSQVSTVFSSALTNMAWPWLQEVLMEKSTSSIISLSSGLGLKNQQWYKHTTVESQELVGVLPMTHVCWWQKEENQKYSRINKWL